MKPTKRLFLLLLVLGLLLPWAAPAEEIPVSFATIEEAAESFLAGEMARRAEKAANPWDRFIFQQGAQEIQISLKGFSLEKPKPVPVSMKLACAQPKVLEQPRYEGDAAAFLKGVVETMLAHTATVNLSLSITVKDGSYQAAFFPHTEHELSNAVRSLASKAETAFTSKTMMSVITDYLMPPPVSVPYKIPPKALDAEEYLPAYTLYLQRNGLDAGANFCIPALLFATRGYQLDVSGGPEAFHFSYVVPDMGELIMKSAETVANALHFDEKAKAYTPAEKNLLLKTQIEKDAITHRYKGSSVVQESYSFSLFALPEKLNPEAFFTHASETVAASLSSASMEIDDAISKMPDYPALPNPKNGLIDGRARGTKFTFKTNADGFCRVVKVYDATTDELESVFFLDNGASIITRITLGSHYFVIGMGKRWYGMDRLFGSIGSYTRTPAFDVLDNHYSYTVTLNPKKHGNTEVDKLEYSLVVDGANAIPTTTP